MKKVRDEKEIFKIIFIIGIFIILNIIFRNFAGQDYKIFLIKWIEEIISNGKINSLAMQIGNYTPPYIYFLVIGTYVTSNSIFWIKLVSNIFTIGIAIVSYYIIKKFDENIKLSKVLLVILLPSVFINSGMITQCDAIYTFFVLLFICLILRGKNKCALCFYGVALGFKLQAIFIAPVFLYLLLKKKIKIWEIIFVPIGFVACMLPSIIYGRNIIDIIKVLFNQSSEYSEIVKSAPNIYSQVHLNYMPVDFKVKMILSVITILISIYVVLKNTKENEYSNKMFLEKVMLLSFIVPYLLPAMHDRYFYMANIFAYIFLLFIDDEKNTKKNKIYLILISVACALPVFLYNFIYVIDMRYSNIEEWLGVTVISSTIMTNIMLIFCDKYLSQK